MSLGVFSVVLFAALLHAGWNVLVKSAPDKLLTTVLVSASAACIALVILPFLTVPARASWPFLAGSAVFQISYYLLVARCYTHADMSQVYPVMRGTAPLLVALVTVFWAGDALSPIAWGGVLGICVGILGMALGTHVDQRTGVRLALLNAFMIAGYTLVDGVGVRRSGATAAYTLWGFLLAGVPLTLLVLNTRRRAFLVCASRQWRLGLAGGVATTSSYGLALWAMTVAPVAVIAALRETSILFGTLIAGVVLHERLGWRRLLSAGIIAGSAAMLRLA
jgi:drug/metabolite transporter (DMT)-like permease